MAPPESEIAIRTGFVSAALALLTSAFVIAKTGRDALFFQGNGLAALPLAYMGIAALSLPMAGLVLLLMRRLGPRAARVATTLAAAGVLLAFFPLARPGQSAAMTALFLYVPLVFGVIFSLSWLLAADLLEGAPRAALGRAYGVIGAASMAGGMTGGLLARAMASTVSARDNLVVAGVLMIGAAIVMAIAHSRYALARPAPDAVTRAAPRWLDLRAVLRRRYVGLLLATGMLAALAGVLVEFQFYLAASGAGRTGADSVRFFANFYLVLSGTALAVQLLILPRLTRRFGVHGTLLVLPAALLGGASVLLGSMSLGVRSILRVTEGGLKSSIHRASWEQAYLPLDAAERAVTKLIVDGAGARIAEGLAAFGLWAWLRWFVRDGAVGVHSTAWVAWALLGCALGWVSLTRVLGRSLARGEASPDAEHRLDLPLPDT